MVGNTKSKNDGGTFPLSLGTTPQLSEKDHNTYFDGFATVFSKYTGDWEYDWVTFPTLSSEFNVFSPVDRFIRDVAFINNGSNSELYFYGDFHFVHISTPMNSAYLMSFNNSSLNHDYFHYLYPINSFSKAITISIDRNLIISGITDSPTFTSNDADFNFKIRTGFAEQLLNAGGFDSYLAKINPDLSNYAKRNVNIEENNKKSITNTKYNIFPIPSNEFINIELNILNKQNIKYEVFDLYGRLLISNQIELMPKTSLRLDVSNLQIGSYYLNIYTDSDKLSKVFIKN